MPEVVDKCVKALMANTDFKPKKKGDSKKDAAWAVCTARHKEGNLTEENFDKDMKILFSDLRTYLKFDEEIATVIGELAKDKSTGLLFEHVRALEDSFYKILSNDEIKDKKTEIKKRIDEFRDLLKKGIESLGKFTEWRYEVIPFTGEIGNYEVVDVGDDKVKINNLPIFMLGEWRDFDYSEKWANEVAIAGFNENKKTGHLPAMCIQHTYDKDGHPVPKPVISYFDNVRLKDDVVYCDTLPIDKQTAKDFPFRSVEINPITRRIDALAIHGAESVPFFKFKPVMFEEGKENDKIVLTFFDEKFKPNEGGEKMKDPKEDLEIKKKNFLQNIMGQVEKFFDTKGEAPKVELFTEEEVTKREEVAKEKAAEEAQTKFMEGQKKSEIDVLMKELFGENGRKEGYVLAPNLKNRVKAFLDSASNQSTIKFTEETGKDADKKTVEKELTQFATIKELFTEILTAPKTAMVELGEKSAYGKVTNPDDTKFTDDQNTELGKKAAAKYGAKKKEKKE